MIMGCPRRIKANRVQESKFGKLQCWQYREFLKLGKSQTLASSLRNATTSSGEASVYRALVCVRPTAHEK